MRVLFIQRDALNSELVVALQLICHTISMAVQLEVDIKYFNLHLLWSSFGHGFLIQAFLILRDRPLRVEQAVFREQLPCEVVFDGQFLRDALTLVMESLLFEEFNAEGRLRHRYFRRTGREPLREQGVSL